MMTTETTGLPQDGAGQMIGLWSDVLATPDVGPTSNFFELGGDSVSLMILLMRIEETFGAFVSHEDIFNAPTPDALWQMIDAQRGG